MRSLILIPLMLMAACSTVEIAAPVENSSIVVVTGVARNVPAPTTLPANPQK